MKYVIHSVSPTPQPFLFTFPFLTAAPMCFLGGPVLIIWYVCVHGACMDHHFWHILTMWDWEHMFSKILRPKLPAKTPAKISQTRTKTVKHDAFFDHVCENEFNRSHAHSVCLNLPIKQHGLQPRTEPLLWDWWFPYGAITMTTTCFSMFLQRSPCFHFITSNRCAFLWNASLP